MVAIELVSVSGPETLGSPEDGDRIQSPKRYVFKIKDRTMDNVQNCDSYINIPWSQTYR
jgi:hypothetical protein